MYTLKTFSRESGVIHIKNIQQGVRCLYTLGTFSRESVVIHIKNIQQGVVCTH